MIDRDMALADFISDPDLASGAGTYLLPGSVVVSYFIQKSNDAIDTGATLEDTLAWKCSPDGDIIGFALCDGVGGSYLGYVASQFLADKLVSTLYMGANASLPGAVLTQEHLLQCMNSWLEEAQIRLDMQPVTGNINPFLAEVLRNRRRDGSHTVFFCGLLDFRIGGHSIFAWLGNVTGQAFDAQGRQLLDMHYMRDDRERWTTTHGALGIPHIQSLPTAEVSHILVASDGLAAQFGQMAVLYDKDREWEYLSTLGQNSYEDDASMVSFWLHHGNIEPLPDLPVIDFSTSAPIEQISSYEAHVTPQQLNASAIPPFILPIAHPTGTDPTGITGTSIAYTSKSGSSDQFITRPDSAIENLLQSAQPKAFDLPADTGIRSISANEYSPSVIADAESRVSSVYVAPAVALKRNVRKSWIIGGTAMVTIGLLFLLIVIIGRISASNNAPGTPPSVPGTNTAALTPAATATSTSNRIGGAGAKPTTPTSTATEALPSPTPSPFDGVQPSPSVPPTTSISNSDTGGYADYIVKPTENLNSLIIRLCPTEQPSDIQNLVEMTCRENIRDYPKMNLGPHCDNLIAGETIKIPNTCPNKP